MNSSTGRASRPRNPKIAKSADAVHAPDEALASTLRTMASPEVWDCAERRGHIRCCCTHPHWSSTAIRSPSRPTSLPCSCSAVSPWSRSGETRLLRSDDDRRLSLPACIRASWPRNWAIGPTRWNTLCSPMDLADVGGNVMIGAISPRWAEAGWRRSRLAGMCDRGGKLSSPRPYVERLLSLAVRGQRLEVHIERLSPTAPREGRVDDHPLRRNAGPPRRGGGDTEPAEGRGDGRFTDRDSSVMPPVFLPAIRRSTGPAAKAPRNTVASGEGTR